MKNKKSFPYFPLILATFPVLSLLGHNIQEVYLSTALRPLIWILGGIILIWAVFFIVVRSFQQAGYITFWVILLFFSYGRVYNALKSIEILNFTLGRHRFLLPIWIFLFVFGTYLIIKNIKENKKLTTLLNAFSIFLLIIPLYQIIHYEVRALNAQKQVSEIVTSQTSHPIDLQQESMPDIYVIVLDAHLRTDVLKETFDLDNQAFVDTLTDMGFYIAPCSMSNYAYTPLSMSSFFNMEYIPDLGNDFVSPNTDKTPLFELIKNNAVRKILEDLGYESYSLVSYQPIAWNDADHYYPLDAASLPVADKKYLMSNFERMLFESTLVKVVFDQSVINTEESIIPSGYPFADHVRQQWYIFDKLQEIAPIRGPKLVFAHINIPHPPYVFYPDGSLIQDPPELPWVVPLPWDEYLQFYSWGTQFVDNAIVPVLETIISESDSPPIILVLGDHGADSANRLAVLSAFYVPEKVKEKIPGDITLVNYFRVIFNEVFGANYEILENNSYLCTQEDPYNFELYKETMPNCNP